MGGGMGFISDYILPIPKVAKAYKSEYDPSNVPSTVLQIEGTFFLSDLTIAFHKDFVKKFHGKLGKIRFWQRIGGVWTIWDIDDFVLKKYNIGGGEYPYALVYSNIPSYDALRVTVEFPADVNEKGEILSFYVSERMMDSIGDIVFEEVS